MTSTVRATIHSNSHKVWDYYTNPMHIQGWNFASNDWCCPSVENDLRVGGSYKARMEATDKSEGFDFVATYTDIIVGKKLAMRLDDGRAVTVTFQDEGDTTLVTTVFETEKQNPVELQTQGWQAILNNFKHYVEQLASVSPLTPYTP